MKTLIELLNELDSIFNVPKLKAEKLYLWLKDYILSSKSALQYDYNIKDLQNINTTNIEPGTIISIKDEIDNVSEFVLIDGTPPQEIEKYIIKPTDFDGNTNNKYWKNISNNITIIRRLNSNDIAAIERSNNYTLIALPDTDKHYLYIHKLTIYSTNEETYELGKSNFQIQFNGQDVTSNIQDVLNGTKKTTFLQDFFINSQTTLTLNNDGEKIKGPGADIVFILKLTILNR